jgi:hypothetical protein
LLIDDGGPVLPPPYLAPQGRESLRVGWGLDDTIGTWCPRCGTEGYHLVMEAIAELHPGMRASVVCSYADGVATPLYALLNGDPGFDGARLEEGLHELSAWTASMEDAMAPSVQRVFYYPGNRHGALVVGPLDATPGLSDFLYAQVDGDPQWATVEP